VAARGARTAAREGAEYLGANTPSAESERIAAFVQRLRELGWIEGRTTEIEVRWAEGRNERLAEIAGVRLKIDIIVGHGTEATVAARQATSVIPIVFPVSGDPVGARCPPKMQRSFLRNGMMPIAAGRALGRRHRTAAHRR
jgi:putative ABC transport system substrate-binding protein